MLYRLQQKMELPDVLEIIREFCKPWFKYHTLGKKHLPRTQEVSPVSSGTDPLLIEFEKAHAESVARDAFLIPNDWSIRIKWSIRKEEICMSVMTRSFENQTMNFKQ